MPPAIATPQHRVGRESSQGEFAAARANYEKATTLTSKSEYEQGRAAFERRMKATQALAVPAAR